MNKFLKNYFLSKYESANYMTQQKSYLLMWFNIAFLLVTLLMIANIFSTINVLSRVSFISAIVPNFIITVVILISLILLKSGKSSWSGNLVSIFVLLSIMGSQMPRFFTNNIFEVFSIAPLYFLGIAILSIFSNRIVFTGMTILLIIQISIFWILSSGKNTEFADFQYTTFMLILITVFLLFILFNLWSGMSNRAIAKAEEEGIANKEQYLKISNILKSIQETSLNLASLSNEMADTSGVISNNAQSQAATSEEMTATIEEINTNMENIYQSTGVQNQSMSSLIEKMKEFSEIISSTKLKLSDMLVLADNISGFINTGKENLFQMNDSMEKISRSSGEMSNFIEVINDISDQINLLSLNAAIEAARAGDTGRGFAVVADEISKLADRTTEGVKSINNLISLNEKEIVTGKNNLSVTVDTISSILNGINSISGAMSEINEFMNKQLNANNQINSETQIVNNISVEIRKAVEEQKIASSDIVKSITQINEISQVNANGTEEISASTEDIASMAEKLKEMVSTFDHETAKK
ncbi:MAG: hypothetical protein JW982_03420 [Spirochaetes bacterium]|nr:hypothetical protein [Spirochaetota bacterium]